MRPSDQVLVASVRWLDLLRRNNLSQAWALIGNDPRFGDLSRTQYHAALEWLLERGLAVGRAGTIALGARALSIPPDEVGAEILAEVLGLAPPLWILDADELIREATDLPQDAEDLAGAIGLTSVNSLRAIRRAKRKVDLELRQRIGAQGELALLHCLEDRWPGSTAHVASVDDSAGYDIAVTLPGGSTHLEVKSTSRRGRLVIYVSRHEFETAQLDPAWRLVVVGLDSSDRLAALATLKFGTLQSRAPTDSDSLGSWESARFVLGGDDLEVGFRPIGEREQLLGNSAAEYAWMPAGAARD